MRINRIWTNYKVLWIILTFTIIAIFVYPRVVHVPQQPYIPYTVVRSSRNESFKKVAIVHYTTTYGSRTDSRSDRFNNNLKNICEILDPEEYQYADSVIASLVDFVRFPSLSQSSHSYRSKYKSQLWVLNTEESPRNSYRTVQIKNITELDDWFNLTATLKPESDVHIQYKGYRIKPEIIQLFENQLNIKYNYTKPKSYMKQVSLFSDTRSYFDALATTLHKELDDRENHYSEHCPYSCNEPLSPEFIQLVKPHLKPIVPKHLNRDIVYIAWFVSNCDSHSGREEYVLQLRSQPGIHVDIYGGCASKLNTHIVPIKCGKGVPNCIYKTLLHYRFYLSFENSKCDTYITEKYWMHGLNGHTVPIVMGAKREQYARIAVPNSYIHTDDYPTVKELAAELHRLNKNDSEYVKYLQWTQIYDVGETYMPTLKYDVYSTLCFIGHYQRLHSLKEQTKEVVYLRDTIKHIFRIGKIKLPNFDWETATTKLIRVSDFYNPKVNCWDNDFPPFIRRAYNFLFTWWKMF